MNNARRKVLEEIKEKIEAAAEALAEVLDEEQEYLDNIPENMQSGGRYEKAEETVSVLEGAISDLENAADGIDEVL